MCVFPCKDCKDRKPACHDYCEKYQQAKAKHERMKADRRVDSYNDNHSVKNNAFSDDMWLAYNVKRALGIDLNNYI